VRNNMITSTLEMAIPVCEYDLANCLLEARA